MTLSGKNLNEACVFQMPRQLRDTFAYMLVFCNVSNANELWVKFRDALALDYLRQYDMELSADLALRDINEVLLIHGKSLEHFGLPIPIIPDNVDVPDVFNSIEFDADEEMQLYTELYPTLNPEQKSAFDAIVAAIDDPTHVRR